MISKKFFVAHAKEHTKAWIRHNVSKVVLLQNFFFLIQDLEHPRKPSAKGG